MLNKSHELLNAFPQPSIIPHPTFHPCTTFEHLLGWRAPFIVELPRLKIQIDGIEYLDFPADTVVNKNDLLGFQQDTYRLWYQIEGAGILQNVTRKTFGTARPGLLGVMERGERHTYLHQRGRFTCFQIRFSLFPALQSKCYWNPEIEGKAIIDESERTFVEQLIFGIIQKPPPLALYPEISHCSGLLELIKFLFDKKLICIEESRFPRNKQKLLVAKAKHFINTHYQSLHHQDALEKECHVDINCLNIVFRKETGDTLYHYLSSVRMEHAKFLLETTNSSVTDIAASTGYPNANSFSRAFKRIENCTPGDFRLRHKKVTN
jgi:AraC-like DNA-binding protein